MRGEREHSQQRYRLDNQGDGGWDATSLALYNLNNCEECDEPNDDREDGEVAEEEDESLLGVIDFDDVELEWVNSERGDKTKV